MKIKIIYMMLPLYRSKVILVVLVGLLVTVGLVATTGVYFLDKQSEEQALKDQLAVKQGEEGTTFGAPLSGTGVVDAEILEAAKRESPEGAARTNSDGTASSTGSGFQSPEYLVGNTASQSSDTTETTVTGKNESKAPAALSPEKNTVYRLRVQGDKMYYPSGKEAMLRGFTWGTWGTTRFHDADRNKHEGANVVRIVLRWWGKYYDDSIDSRDDNAPGNIDPEHLAELDRMVNQAVENGLWIDLAIDSDCGQNGLQEDSPGTKEYCDPTGKYGSAGHNFWTDPSQREKFFETWKFIADRYKNTPYIAFFELLPEPNPITFPATEISKFYQELIQVVHPIDSRTPFLIGGRAYMAKLIESSYINTEVPIVYTGNMFIHMDIGAEEEIVYDLEYRLKQITDFRTKHQVPVFVQQTGARYEDDPNQFYTNAILSLLNVNKVGWAWWEYRQQGPFMGGYGIWYLKNAVWVKKDMVLNVISQYFKQ
jgi:hypothetical protein